VSNLHTPEHLQHSTITSGQPFAGFNSAKRKPFVDWNVSRDIDSAKMMIVLVGAGRHILPVLMPSQRRSSNLL
jgi:hypothetical protein